MKTNLAGPEFESRVLTFFALGGSGARAVEPLLHLCAMGLGPRRLTIVIVDPDQANEGVTRARRLIELYRRTRDELGGGANLPGYFRTELLDPVSDTLVWSPIADDEHLPNTRFAARVDRNAMGDRGALGRLYDLLFAERIRDMDLGMGFRGVPAIGTVFMHRLRTQRFFEQILQQAPQEPDSVFFSVGSIFGGTGAAALPVVGRALSTGLRGVEPRPDIPGIDPRRLGAALLLPYFTLPSPRAGDAPGELRPETSLFAQNAAAALPTYVRGDARYGAMYVLGDSEPREQDANAIGGDAQRNASHYIELFAALAALDFAARGGEARGQKGPVFRATAVRSTNVGWDDLPLAGASLRRMMGALVAAHTFLTVFRPDGKPRPELAHVLAGATWLELLRMSPAQLERHSTALDALGAYYAEMWGWLRDLRGSTPALEVANATDRPPSQISLNQTLRHPGGGQGGREKKFTDPFQVFRAWNEEAHAERPPAGLPGMLEVMRRGSEGFAEEWFGAPAKER